MPTADPRGQAPDGPTPVMELLFCRPGGSESRCYALADGETMVGRRPDCRIVLDAPSISPRHARLFSVDGHAVIYAIDSAWPVYVNGKPVERHELVNGDEIELGHYRMRYVDPATAGGDDVQAVPDADTDTAFGTEATDSDPMTFEAPVAPVADSDDTAPGILEAPDTAPEELEDISPIIFDPGPSTSSFDAGQPPEKGERHTVPEEPDPASSPDFHLDILTGINQGRRVTLTHDMVVLGFNHQRLVEIRRIDGVLSLRRIDDEADAALNGTPVTDEPVEAGAGDVISLQRIELRVHSS